MTCKEFKKEFPDTQLLVFVMDKFTHLFKVNSNFITYFMRSFADEHVPKWNRMFFYEIQYETKLLDDEGKFTRIKDKAKFLHYIARAEEQKATKCFLKWVPNEPDLTILENKHVKVTTIYAK